MANTASQGHALIDCYMLGAHTQALAHDVPVLMNAYISGGWKYVNEHTGASGTL